MTIEQFTYWLQGFMELTGKPLTKREQIIKDHLAQVFTKKTPEYSKLILGNGATDLIPSNPPYPYVQAVPCTTQGTEPTEYYKSKVIC